MTIKAEKFFNAKTIAVIGAAREEWKVGHIIFKNLVNVKHLRVFPVNPNTKEILGHRCFKDLFEIPYEVDLIIIAVKSEIVPEILIQAGKRKVSAAIILSAGFSESGNTELEEKIKEIARKNNINILGPNCFGILSPYKEINTTFFEGMPEKGGIAFISQSGALGVAVLDLALKEKIGFSGFVSLGNMLELDFSDFIEYFARDDKTKVIVIYMEGLKEARGKRFVDTCQKAGKIKPIFILKSGKSLRGKEAAKSHTAALASEQGVYESIFKQAGIIEVESVSELFSVSNLYSKYGKIGKRACIVTNAGGLGVLCTDSCSANNIEIASLPDEIIEKLNKILPSAWSHNNPIDLIGDALAERYGKVFEILDKEKWFDFFIVLLTPQYMTQPLETAKLILNLKKPVVACFMGGEKVNSSVEFMKKNNIPIFEDAGDIGKVCGKILK